MKHLLSYTESIRNKYSKIGVDKYYQSNIETYINPHEKNIQRSLDWVISKINIGYFLDLSCGNGEVTNHLNTKDITNGKGSDPYLCDTYIKNTGKECSILKFEDIANNGLSEKFDTIICSYALHLCEKSYFNNLLYSLSSNCKYFVVISPSKYPIIEGEYFTLINSIIINRTHCRIFESNI